MTTRRARPPISEQAGLSLVEVILYSTLSALVLTVLAGLFSATLQAQAVALQMDAATGAAEVLQASVRNASEIQVTSSTRLVARVADGVSGWQCRAWELTPKGELVYSVGSKAKVMATGVSGPANGDPAFTSANSTASYSLVLGSGKIKVPIAGTVFANAFGPGIPESCA